MSIEEIDKKMKIGKYSPHHPSQFLSSKELAKERNKLSREYHKGSAKKVLDKARQ